MESTRPVSGSHSSRTARVMLGGDVMLGRTVKEYILLHGPQYPLGPIAGLMRGADLTIVNLECAITSSDTRWPGAPKAFYFGAPLQAVHSLVDAGVDLVSLANNHVLDYGIDGLRDTLRQLHRHGITQAGAGETLSQALTPAVIDRNGLRFGMAAFCDHQEDFAAQLLSPGMAYLDLKDEAATLAVWRSELETLRQRQVDWPILSLHWGPNMVWRPAERFRRLAHLAIDMGWKIVFGHSAHVFQGIELYRGCPIIYAAGDLVDDYYVEPEFANDHQLLIELEVDGDCLRRMLLHPIYIEDCQARPATGGHFVRVLDVISALCQEMGATVKQDAVHGIRIEVGNGWQPQ
ncbi:poly-gamma-glutamate synthesis protein (capsule biosynthesis protein) [Paucimonas lemoignei]|uniref:Poly-gamma-glutamate synthesis protein (Capsule biosynthesis protein) n=1 Tax=Paucimonas lemoignei TaxID=29443 RepID=A0A4R3I3K6_PAULE|nr:CapA family protein [Paucimonas lemoignei]TCS39275.1 poly-gamma-glutamate synthesis protein (capsule biosynthesis protein) [Paucimonas lemoignei]